MNIQENISLKAYNTFGIDVKAKFFIEINGLAQLQKVLELKAYPQKFVVSGGSNMLLTKDVDALVIHINLRGITIVDENEDEVVIKVMAGENWHELVLWSLDQGIWRYRKPFLDSREHRYSPNSEHWCIWYRTKGCFLKVAQLWK